MFLWEVQFLIPTSVSQVSFDGMTGPISISSGSRMKLFVEVLKLNYEFGLESPVLTTVGNWTQGINYEYEGLLIADKSLLTNEKPVINKTLVITTIQSSSCYTKEESGEEKGYCVDLAKHLSKLVGFTYKFKTVGDGRYGKPDGITGVWDGMIGEVTRGVTLLSTSNLKFSCPTCLYKPSCHF